MWPQHTNTSSGSWSSQVQYQPFGARARYTGHHHFAGSFLGIGEHRVALNWTPLQHLRLARTADAFIAAAQNGDACFLKDFQNRLVRTYFKTDARPLAHHLELVEGFSGFLRR